MTSPLRSLPSTSSPPLVLGRVEPRLWTPPLRDLDDPESSWGYDFIDFCVFIGYPLDLWQQWLAIHLGELFPDGSPRYQKAIILVARQNGKSMFANLLVLYWMFVEGHPDQRNRVKLVYGTHKDRAEAKKAWREVIDIAEGSPVLMAALDPISEKRIVKQIGEEDFLNLYGSHYTFGAPNRKAGRGRAVNRALIDELLTHYNRDCWNSLVPSTSAQLDSLVLCLSNEGDERSIVLHEEHDAALEFIETGEGDERTFLASWSSPSGSDPMNVEALAYSNPSMNRFRANGTGISSSWLLSEARSRIKAGGRTLAEFKIEHMCMRIDQLDAAIDPDAWRACGVKREDALDMAGHRRQVALVFEVAQDHSHASLIAAVKVGDLVWGEVVATWKGFGCRAELRRDLPDWVERIKPRKVGAFAGGPAQSVIDEFTGKRIRNVTFELIRAEDVTVACAGLEEQVMANQFRHSHDPVLDGQVRTAQRMPMGDAWRFARRGSGPIDAVYGMAGAVHLARTIPVLGPAV